ncbi:hypothetical protein EMIT0P228_90169 [Pseudomonas brassicacearum]
MRAGRLGPGLHFPVAEQDQGLGDWRRGPAGFHFDRARLHTDVRGRHGHRHERALCPDLRVEHEDRPAGVSGGLTPVGAGLARDEACEAGTKQTEGNAHARLATLGDLSDLPQEFLQPWRPGHR